MKKMYLATHNLAQALPRRSWGTMLLLCALAALFVRLIAPNFFWTVTTPIFNLSNALSNGSHAFFAGFNTASSLTLQNEALQNENTALANKNQELHKKLEEIKGLIDSKKEDERIVGVLARPPVSPYDTLLLNGGIDDGISLGMGVFGAGGTPLGVVSAVSASFSQVLLLSSHGVQTAGWIGEHSVPITLKGAGGGAFTATIARAANVTEGDVVYVPGPGMLPIGTVTRVDGDPSSPSVTLRISARQNPFSIAWVTLRLSSVDQFQKWLSATTTS